MEKENKIKPHHEGVEKRKKEKKEKNTPRKVWKKQEKK